MAFAAAAAKAPTHSTVESFDTGFHDRYDDGATRENRKSWRDMFYPRRESGKFDESHIMANIREKRSEEDASQLEHITAANTNMTTFEAQGHAEGALYDANGKVILQPAPTRDPNDPLNMTTRHKAICCLCLCFFGALAAAAELILGAMLPVFVLEYAGIDPKMLLPWSESPNLLVQGSNPLKTLELFGGPPIWETYLLASLPILIIGLSNLVLIPAAVAVGRRSVLLVTGVIALVGACWAGTSQSLGSHLGARCFQALGAGTVESLIPFIIQDMVYVHQRNTYISCIFAAQGLLIIAIGFASPYIIINLSWRYVYFITAGAAGFFLCGVALFLPETKYHRTRAEMEGQARDDSGVMYRPRTWANDLKLINASPEWRKGWNAFLDTLRTFFYPQIFFITMLNSAMIATAFAAAYVVAPALLVQPWSWPFLHLGFLLTPILIAAFFVAGVTGKAADWLANLAAKSRGRRVPENQLLNMILPVLCALVGCVIFGLAGQDPSHYSWVTFLLALGLMGFGFLGANTVGAVYVLECYPHLAGPALVNIASFRCLIAFALSFKVSEWIADLGYLKSFMIYTVIMAIFTLLLPVVYIYGPAWRKRWPAEGFGDR